MKEGNLYVLYLNKGVLFRHCRIANGKEFHQVVVPKKMRSILWVAHDITLAGHQDVKRTTDSLLESFYWPGVQADIKGFVRSCDEEQSLRKWWQELL